MKINLAHARHRPQGGVVLIIALILLVVIAFSSSYILRNALFGDLLTHNLSSGQVAEQAAESALKYCSNLIVNPAVGAAVPPVQPSPAQGQPNLWKVAGNWNNTAITVSVPLAVLQSNATANTQPYARAPQCMMEFSSLVQIQGLSKSTVKPVAIWVTARGYSPDYQEVTPDQPAVGSEVMLQSILRMNACPPQLANLPNCS